MNTNPTPTSIPRATPAPNRDERKPQTRPGESPTYTEEWVAYIAESRKRGRTSRADEDLLPRVWNLPRF